MSKEFEKCSNYAVLGTVVMNTLMSMRRFSNIPNDIKITKVYNTLKKRAEMLNKKS